MPCRPGRFRESDIPTPSWPPSIGRPMLRRAVIVTLLLVGVATSAPASDEDDAGQPKDPPANKLTLAYYDFSSGTAGFDVNLRHTFRSMTGWVGTYHEDDGFDQARAGYEYDFRSAWLTLVPSVQAATHDF